MAKALTFSDGRPMCGACCWGDRCDKPEHYYRPDCPVCKGTGTPPLVQRLEHCEVYGLIDCLVTIVDGDWALCEDCGHVETCPHVEAINEWCEREADVVAQEAE